MSEQTHSSFEPTSTWYSDARHYWESVPSTVEGMLGGYGRLTDLDVRDSIWFLDEFVHGKVGARGRQLTEPRISTELACDCGAGIGRVTKNLLLKLFNRVDLVECTKKFLDQARSGLLKEEAEAGRIDRYIHSGLEKFCPDPQRYDLIWCQWVLNYLTDGDLVLFLQRCMVGLKPNGIIGIKENCAVSEYVVDSEDSSVTRSDAVFRSIFKRAGLEIIKETVQSNFPGDLFTVKMYALAPATSTI
ncbi:alpha-N-methyltransferase NTM1 [Syncephalis fuscata]|nr:alpha-N-methyltransferase NTM1 [Syncephalis fuscata]